MLVLSCLAVMGHPVEIPPEFIDPLVNELAAFMKVKSRAVVRSFPSPLKIVSQLAQVPSDLADEFGQLVQGVTTSLDVANMIKAVNIACTSSKKTDVKRKTTLTAFLKTLQEVYAQHECEYSLLDVFGQFAHLHVHGADCPKEVAMGCTCPYHDESLVVHLVRAFLLSVQTHASAVTVVYNEDGTMSDAFLSLFQKAVTALLHDVGKPSTRIVSGKSTAFHTHGEEGAQMLNILYDGAILHDGGFNRWFPSPKDWCKMTAVVEIHMEGCNMSPSSNRTCLLAARLSTMENGPEIFDLLCVLARVDKSSAFSQIPTDLIMADDLPSIETTLSLLRDGPKAILEAGREYGTLGRMIIKLDGPSCSGKSTVAEVIRNTFEEQGKTCVIVSRDNVIRQLGGRGVAEKSEIDSTMSSIVENAFHDGSVVLFDTCQVYFADDRYLNTSGAFVVMVSVRRIGPITQKEAERHHGGDFAAQLATSGATSPLNPSPGQGSQPMAMKKKRTVGSSGNPFSASNDGNPHIKFLVPTVTQNSFLHEIALGQVVNFAKNVVASGILDEENPTDKMTMPVLLTYLFEKHHMEKMSNAERSAILTEWFKARKYSVSTPCNRFVFELRVALLLLHGIANKAIREISPEDDAKIRKTFAAFSKEEICEMLQKAQVQNDSAIAVKYMDGINRDFFAPWHFECRSPAIVFEPDGFRLIPAMQRGMEVLGKDTQDMSDGKTSTYSSQMQHIINLLNGGDWIKSITDPDESAEMLKKIEDAQSTVSDTVTATGKRDGSCMRVFVTKPGTCQYKCLSDRIVLMGTKFEKAFTHESLVQSDGMWAIFLATNGTLGVGTEEMEGYFATSMIASDPFGESLVQMVSMGVTPVEVATYVCDDGKTMFGRFIAKVMEILPQVQDDTDAITILFEAICPNRTNQFSGQVHGELAVSYEKGSMSLLSAVKYVDGKLVCYTHSKLIHSFSQPYYWSVSVATLLSMANALSDVTMGKMTMDKFLAEFRPDGGDGPIDPEGFVAYFTVGDNFIYTKVKTKAYYDLHKLKLSNLSWLLTLPDIVGKQFPTLTIMKAFFEIERQKAFCEELAQYATSADMMSCLAGKALESYQKAFAERESSYEKLMKARVDGTPDVKLEQDLLKQSSGLVKRILGMKESGKVWNTYVLATMIRTFGPVHEDYVTLVGGLTKKFLLEEIKVQEPGYLDRLGEILEPSNVEKNGLPKSLGEIFMAVV